MKKRWVILSMLVIGLSVSSLTGCGSSSSSTSTDTKDAKATAEATKETTKEVTKEATKEADKSSDKKSDDTDTSKDSEEQTPVSEIQGEGTTDDSVPDLTGVETTNTNEDAEVTDNEGSSYCTLTVTNAAITDQRDSNNEDDPEMVIVIDYVYTNESSDNLLIDDMSFKLLDADGNLCDPYYAGFLTSAELVEPGETGNAQIAFGVSSTFGEGTLVFTDSNAQTTAFDIVV